MVSPADQRNTDRAPDAPRGRDASATEQAAREALESKIMFLENTLEALGEVVLVQGKELERLNDRLAALHKRVTAPTEHEDAERSLEDDRPPHY